MTGSTHKGCNTGKELAIIMCACVRAHRAPGGAESAAAGGIQTQPGAEIHLCLETSHSI